MHNKVAMALELSSPIASGVCQSGNTALPVAGGSLIPT